VPAHFRGARRSPVAISRADSHRRTGCRPTKYPSCQERLPFPGEDRSALGVVEHGQPPYLDLELFDVKTLTEK
jgi:hypothetical protein